MKQRSILLAGATGLVGQEILEGLLRDESVAVVHVLGRRQPAQQHPKLRTHIVDFTALPALPPADEVYLALGTTIKVAGSQEAFRAVDFDANLAVAKAAVATGAKRAGLVSAMGANAHSRVFYSRVKGELEEALGKLPFEGLVIARPSMLIGDRQGLGQAVRQGEVLAHEFSRFLGCLIPANYKPIRALAVAQALLSATPASQGHTVMLSGDMRQPSNFATSA